MRLRHVIICLCAVLFSHQGYCQHKADSTLHMEKIKDALETKNTGLIFTVLGAGSLIVAAVASGVSLNTTAALGTAGLIAVAIGTPMWIIGANNHKKYTRQAQSLTVRLVASPYHSGLTVAYRF